MKQKDAAEKKIAPTHIKVTAAATVAGAYRQPGDLIPLDLSKDAKDRDATDGDVGAVTMATAEYLVRRANVAAFHTGTPPAAAPAPAKAKSDNDKAAEGIANAASKRAP